MNHEIKNETKIAVITSRRAYSIIKDEINSTLKRLKNIVRIDVFVLPVDIVSLLDTSEISKLIEKNPELKEKLSDYDYLLIPGSVKGDARIIENVVGIKCFKASSEPSLLHEVINKLIDGIELSKTVPAEEITHLDLLKSVHSHLSDIWRNSKISFVIEDLKIPLRGPPFVLAAEIPITTSVEEAVELGLRYEEEGADIIVIGGKRNHEDDFMEKVRLLDKKLNHAVVGADIDSAKILKKSVRNGVQFILTLTPRNYFFLEEVKKEAAFVVSTLSQKNINEIKIFELFLEKIKSRGFEKVIVDPLISTPSQGFIQTIERYSRLINKFKEYPFFACYGNYIELVDVDSHGLIAFLSFIMAELGVSVVMVTSDSWKTRESVGEAWIALQMAGISYAKKSNPHNIGLDLLLYRSKNPTVYSPPGDVPTVISIDGEEKEIILDKWGYVTIGVENRKKEILVCINHYQEQQKNICYKGRKAKSLYKVILANHNYFSLQHAAYLGYELAKAEISLITGKKYIQDEILFEELSNKLKKYDTLKHISEKWARGDLNPGPPGYQPGAPPS